MRAASDHIERMYVPTDSTGPSDGARIGVAWLGRHHQDWPGEPLVIVPTADHALRMELVPATQRFWWVTAVAYRSADAQGWSGGPALLLYPPDARVLDWFDKSRSVKALCVVQGSQYDTTAWARARQPTDLTTGRRYPSGPGVEMAVEAALLPLRDAASGRHLGTRRDVEQAVGRLRPVVATGRAIAPLDLEAWALAHDWSLLGAHHLAAEVSKIAVSGDAGG